MSFLIFSMPELPEVETIRRGLTKKVLHKKITSVEVRKEQTIRTNPKLFSDFLVSHSFISIDRIGKLLIFHLSDKKHHLLIHLKMTGQLIYRSGKLFIAGGHSLLPTLPQLPHNHTRVILEFADKSRLFFNDMRLFGYMRVVTIEELKKIQATYGIEPLTPTFTLANFRKALRGRATSIKAVLLNQNLIAGMGNIYVDEACFRAGIRPARQANQLTVQEVKKLRQACAAVIKQGIEKQGTTFNSFVNVDGQSGGFSKSLRVYNRTGKKCLKCKFGTIKKIRTAGRGTHYCPRCQE